MIWHFRLGHPSFAYVRHLFPTLFQKLPYQNFQSNVCCFLKANENPIGLQNFFI